MRTRRKARPKNSRARRANALGASPAEPISRRKVLSYGIGVLGASLLNVRCRRRAEPPHVVLVTLDTTRADHLGCYGHERPTSPELDRLAEESILYTGAISTSSWTLPAHASLFTGKFTTSHGARYDPEGPLRLTDGIDAPGNWSRYRARGLSPDELTLAELLRQAGYITGAVVGGPWMKKVFGLDAGFESYDDTLIHNVNGRLASEVTSAALAWLGGRAPGPLFLFLNYFDPHSPYSAPEPYTYAFFEGETPDPGKELTHEDLGRLYDAEILYMDHHIGRLRQGLEKLGLYDETMLVVTADHGELLGEHGKLGHGTSLYQEEIHVPLLVKYPRGEAASARMEEPVQLVDVFSMIVQRLGIPVPGSAQGGVPPALGHPVVSETYPLPFMSSEGHWRVLFDGPVKFHHNSLGNHLLFDLSRDPEETDNLAPREGRRVDRMERLVSAYLSSLPKPPDAGPVVELDEDTKKALRSLGYVK